MLSRIAESLFWIGRYVERADDTARILDVHVHMLLEDSPLDEQRSCADLLAAMGVGSETKPDELDVATVLKLLAYDHQSPSAIVGALRAARENARGAREAISSEMWECLNTTHNAVPQQVATSHRIGPHGFFTFIRARTAMMNGLSDSTMSRDDGWRFLVLGRSLERVDMTARLLSLRFGSSRHLPGRVALLRSCGAYEAYLRTHRGVLDTSRVVRFLLLDRLFPRSIFHALLTAEECLADLSPSAGSRYDLDEARMALGRARTRLEFSRVEDLLVDLPAHLEFDIHDAHDELLVTARSIVETSVAEPTPDATSWADLASVATYDEFAELLAPTAYVPVSEELTAQARELAAECTRPLDAVHAVIGWVDGQLRYQRGTTGVHTSALEALRAGEGVCQDFAHLTLVLLRAINIPCRYLSGYLHPAPDAQRGDVVVGESHAWVEVWTGDWWACDPTNGSTVGQRHVLVGRGRDYADVSPLRGIYTGGGSSALGVTVEIERLR